MANSAGLMGGVAGLKAKSPSDNFKVVPNVIEPKMTKTQPSVPSTQSTSSGLLAPGKSQFNNASALNPGGATLGGLYGSLIKGAATTLGNMVFPGLGNAVSNGEKVLSSTRSSTPDSASPSIVSQTPTAYASSGSAPVSSSNTQSNPLYALPGETYEQYATRQSTLTPTQSSTQPRVNSSPEPQETPGNPSNGLLQKLIMQLQQGASQPSQQYMDAYKAAQEANKALQLSKTNEANALAANSSNPIPLEFQQGRGQVLQNQYLAQQNALSSELQGASNLLGAANTQQGLQQQGLLGAAGIVSPVQVPYSNQYINPLTGEPIGGGQNGGSLEGAVQNIAQKIQNGTMSYDQGIDALGSYGQGGVNALQQALGPNFDVVSSNAQAGAKSTSIGQTGSLGGQLSKSAETVKGHMQTLKQAYQSIGAQYGIPMLNQGVNAIARAFGDGSIQSYNIALQNVRDELSKILGGGEGTDSTRATAHALLPDNMTPAQLEASIKTATELMDTKIQEYTRTSGTGNSGGSVVQTSVGAINTNW